MVAAFDSEWGIILIVVAVLVLFGGSRIPKLFHSLGSAQSEYKRGLAEGQAQAAAGAVPGATTTNPPVGPAVTATPPAVPTVEAPGVVPGQPVPPQAPPAG